MYGSSRRKVSEQRKAIPNPKAKPKPKRVVKQKRSTFLKNAGKVNEDNRKDFKADNDAQGPSSIRTMRAEHLVPRNLGELEEKAMKAKFRQWKKTQDLDKSITYAQAQRIFNAFARGPPKRAPPAPRRPRNGNGNGNGK